MKNIIRKILNFRPKNSTKAQREELIASIVAYSEFCLEKDMEIRLKGEISCVTDDSLSKGNSYFQNGRITASSEIFTDDSMFLEEIAILAHETCHFGQAQKENGSLVKEKKFAYQPFHFQNLLMYLMQITNPDLCAIAKFMGLKLALSYDENLQKAYSHLYSYYSMQDVECEARTFSIKVVGELLETAQNLNLSPEEKQRLKMLKRQLKKLSQEYKANDEKFVRIGRDREFMDFLDKGIDHVYASVLEGNYEFAEILDNEQAINLFDEEMLFAVAIIEEALEVKYDEELGQKLFNCLLKSKKNCDRDAYLAILALTTPVEISKENEEEFKKTIAQILESQNMSYEEFLSEKSRTLIERNALKNGSFEISGKYDLDYSEKQKDTE